jgi:IS30 family transposase
VKHQDNLKGQLFSGKMINEQSLINLINNMPYKHFILKQKNELSILLRTKTKKREIAKLLGKGRITIWREYKRGKGTNGKYYTRKSNRLAKEKNNFATITQKEIQKAIRLLNYGPRKRLNLNRFKC